MVFLSSQTSPRSIGCAFVNGHMGNGRLAVTVEGTREILGLWAGDGGEGAKYWPQVLTEIKNRWR